MTDIEAKVIKHEEQIHTLFNRVDKLENVTTEINKLALNVEKIANNQSAMLEQQGALAKDVEKLKLQPAEDAHDMKQKVVISIITTVIGVILGAVLTLIIKK